MDTFYDLKKQAREQWMLQHGPIAQSLSRVKHKIAIFSGKGGVGKTTSTVNLAVSLAKKGFKVAILDADVHGPAVPKILGASGKLDVASHRMPGGHDSHSGCGGHGHHKAGCSHEHKHSHGNRNGHGNGQGHAHGHGHNLSHAHGHGHGHDGGHFGGDTHNLRFEPVKTPYGVDMVSVDSIWPGRENPVMWRGPHKMRVIRQFLSVINWGELDYLLVDLPPGTGDEVLTIMSSIPGLDGMVVVSTPQDVSTIVCSKAINTAREMNVPILGVVENMSVLCCPHCNNAIKIFGHRTAQRLARMMEVDFLGSIPFMVEVNESSDEGIPVVVKYPESLVALEVGKIADCLVSKVESAGKGGDQGGN